MTHWTARILGSRRPSALPRWTPWLTALVLVGGTAVAVTTSTSAAGADSQPAGVSPVVQRDSTNVTADALPTVQIDGVVWAQAVVDNTVYAGGQFSNARPAGAAAGSQTTTRNNLLAFDIRTGNLITSFAPSVNGQVKTIAVSPDKTRIYVGGAFSQADGVTRNRIAAYSTSTGQLISSFAPSFNMTISAISVSNSAVFVGGSFSTVNGVARSRLAALDPATGALLSWAPVADATVNALVVVPDQSRVIVGGQFATINGAASYGLGAIDDTGALVPWAATQVIQDAGSNAAVLNLSTDGRAVYTSSYVYGSGGNFEGHASIDPDSGSINWLADCHGDTYGTFGTANVLYSVSHQHFCGNIGGFPDTNPRNRWYRTTAFTQQVTGTVQHNAQGGGGYGDFYGKPSPSLIDWTPELAAGTYTGQSQAAWTVVGNSQYVVEGGEFPKVNNTAQQGLVRFAVPSIAPNKEGPRLSAGQLNLALTARSSTSVRASWTSDWDRDDRDLTYTLYRNNVAVSTFTSASESWSQPTVGAIDTGLSIATTYTYRVKAADPNGNYATSSSVSITTPSTATPPDGAYVKDVLGQGAGHYWRLDQATGDAKNLDYAAFGDLTLNSGVTAGAVGAINDGDTAASFDGSSSGFASTATQEAGPNVFTEEAWLKTTSTSGGKIIGFGDQATGNSNNYDRHIFMHANGQVTFGVYNNGGYTIDSPNALNDGAWHQVIGTLSSAGMAFYVDGALVGTNGGTTTGQPYLGYWRVGGDSSWADSNYFTGQIDDASIYPTALSLTQIRQQYNDSGHTRPGSTAPADRYGSTVYNDSPYLYYRLDETSGTKAVDLSGNGADGGYYGSYTQGQPSAVSQPNSSVGFSGNGDIASNASMTAPSTYSEEIWFNTTSTSGGKLIGFGDQRSGNSNNYDRHIYMLANGQLDFGTYTGQLNLATSPKSYNDGAWHQAVATQGPDGMTLFVDGVSVATNPQTSAQPYTGVWRIGGDNLNGWGADGAYFSGSLDEAAVYLTELTPGQVQAHYAASLTAAPTPPVAAFTSGVDHATASLDASGSSDVSGTITGYAWNFGDGTSGSGKTTSHSYTATGTYPVTLTVTDDRNSTASVTHNVSVTVNHAPTAAFTVSSTGLTSAFDASTSSDPDGDALTYAWNFGDSTTGTGVTPTHNYTAAGTYSVTLTVTDPGALTGTATATATATQPNRAPSAAFTATPTASTVAFNAGGSTDPDGDTLTYAWKFGDSTTGTGVSPTHTYPSSNTYPVTLTVTDPSGATGSVTQSVTVTDVVAADAFGRTVTGGWGNADTGGPWTLSNGNSNFSVNGSRGSMALTSTTAAGPIAVLKSVSATNVDELVDVTTDKAGTGNGITAVLIARRTTAGEYRAKVKILPNGVVHLSWSKVVAGKETSPSEVVVNNLTYNVGDQLRVRFDVTGDGTTTTVRGRVWKVGTTEPTTWQVNGTDTETTLQGAGAIGLIAGLGSTVSNAPVSVSFDNLLVTRI